MKILLCASLFSLCVGCAFWLTRKYRKRKDFFYNLDLFNERLVNEVSYTKIPLPAFAEKYEFTGDFKKMLEEKRTDFQADRYEFAYLTEDEIISVWSEAAIPLRRKRIFPHSARKSVSGAG